MKASERIREASAARLRWLGIGFCACVVAYLFLTMDLIDALVVLDFIALVFLLTRQQLKSPSPNVPTSGEQHPRDSRTVSRTVTRAIIGFVALTVVALLAGWGAQHFNRHWQLHPDAAPYLALGLLVLVGLAVVLVSVIVRGRHATLPRRVLDLVLHVATFVAGIICIVWVLSREMTVPRVLLLVLFAGLFAVRRVWTPKPV